ncbi:unnamed protein product, partial [Meganyctiphanes norvegica]
MAPVFPLAKLAFLFVKQVAKPLSAKIKKTAIHSQLFREKICMPPARLYNWGEVRMKMYMMNISRSKGKAFEIPKLNEQAAIELGANLLGEGVIFTVAVVILAYEVNRQKEKDRKKEDEERDFVEHLECRINDLTFSNEELDTKIRELTRSLIAVQHKVEQQKLLVEKQKVIAPAKVTPHIYSESSVVPTVRKLTVDGTSRKVAESLRRSNGISEMQEVQLKHEKKSQELPEIKNLEKVVKDLQDMKNKVKYDSLSHDIDRSKPIDPNESWSDTILNLRLGEFHPTSSSSHSSIPISVSSNVHCFNNFDICKNYIMPAVDLAVLRIRGS